jgi:hypothetical protein
MSKTWVPNLVTYSGVIADDEVFLIPADKHRTFLEIQDVDGTGQDIRIWVGPTAPPNDVTTWPKLLDGSTVFPQGVQGPIIVAEIDRRGSTLAFMSALSDETASSTAWVNVCASDNLVHLGDQLVADGFNLVFCT